MKEEGDNQVIKCSADCDIVKPACCIASLVGGGEYTALLVLLLITIPGMYIIRWICRHHHNPSTSVYCKIQS